ncbi:hypothetical protein N0V82_007589 [Gnomoniopsis sp. IMI 355080]|nr:hypothetical protein N0V82_007589 [Gnomoniopsis sp. IMI 355080]
MEEDDFEMIRRALKSSLRKVSTRAYPVLVVATDGPQLSSSRDRLQLSYSIDESELWSSIDEPQRRGAYVQYDLLDQIGRRALEKPVEICPVPRQSQRRLLKQDEGRKVARENIRRIQLYTKRHFGQVEFAEPKLLEPPCEWDFIMSSPISEILTGSSLPQDMVIFIALQIQADCSEPGIRRVITNALTLSDCLISWADKAALEAVKDAADDDDDDDHYLHATFNDEKAPQSIQSRKVKDVIDRIKRDKNEFEWEYPLIGSIVEPDEIDCTWADIDIDRATKSTIDRIISRYGSNYGVGNYGILKSGGVQGALLYGPPGSGKTHLTRILAKESHATMIHVSAAEVLRKWVGETEKLLKALFRLGRMLFPSIIFIDEADALLRIRKESDPEWVISQINSFLGEADGLLKRRKSAFLLLATNNPLELDKAVLRRVPAKIYMGPPTSDARQEIFRICLRDEDLHSSVDIHELASRTHRYSGSDINAVCFHAASVCQFDLETSANGMEEMKALPRRVLTMVHFDEALEAISPTITESVMRPVSHFASEFDPPAFATTQAYERERDQALYNQLKGTETRRSKDMDIQDVTKVEALAESDRNVSVHGTDHLQPAVSHTGPQPILSLNYNSLDNSRREIRLLELLDTETSENGGPIQCSMHTVSFDENPAFAALSYVWGDPDQTGEVWVDDYRVQVRVNLIAALRWAKVHWQKLFPSRPASELRIWADALCIDQENISERNHQVAMMGQLYTKAEIVLCSIASQDVEICLALELYRKIHETLFLSESPPSVSDLVHRRWLARIPSLVNVANKHRRDRGPAWNALSAFSGLRYWRRAWIVQEIFLAQQVLLICDAESLDFKYLFEISSLLNLRELQRGQFEQPRHADNFVDCEKCYETITSPAPVLEIYGFKNSGMSSRMARAELQNSLLGLSVKLEASDPRDVIYGLLGLSKLPIAVDYNQEPGTVFAQYLQHWTRRLNKEQRDDQDAAQTAQASAAFTFCLAIAGLGIWRRDEVTTSPSWTPNISSPMARQRLPDKGLLYGALKFWHFPDLFGPRHHIDIVNSSLLVDGFVLDSVARSTVMMMFNDGSLHWSFWDHINDFISKNPTYVTGIPTLQALLRVMTGCNSNATLPLGETHAKEIIARGLLLMDLWAFPTNDSGVRRPSIRLIDSRFNPDQTSWDATQAYRWLCRAAYPEYPALAEVVPDSMFDWEIGAKSRDTGMPTEWEESALIHSVGGFVGMCPEDVSEKDLICVIEGCNKPVILRQVGDHYNLIGTCYVLGIMNWDEVRDKVQKEKLERHRFEIR